MLHRIGRVWNTVPISALGSFLNRHCWSISRLAPRIGSLLTCRHSSYIRLQATSRRPIRKGVKADLRGIRRQIGSRPVRKRRRWQGSRSGSSPNAATALRRSAIARLSWSRLARSCGISEGPRNQCPPSTLSWVAAALVCFCSGSRSW